jgi:replicative DNA helicase
VPDVALEDGGVSKAEDINDLAKTGKLPADPRSEAKPVNQAAKTKVEDEGRLVSVKQMLVGSLERALKPVADRKIITTGHYRMDRDTGGFQKGDVWAFGADTSWGKSANLLMLCDENIRRGFRILIVSFEDPERIYADRLMMRRSGFGVPANRVNSHRFKNGNLEPDERDRLVDVCNGGEDVPVYFNAVGKSVEATCKQLRKIVPQEGIDLVAFDYLQAADHDKPQKDRRLQLNYISRVMTDTIKTLNRCGIIYSQITPPEDNKIPGKYSLRDSKDVSNGAEVIAIGFEPAVDIKRGETTLAKAGEKVIRLAKNKPGPGKKDEYYLQNWDSDHGCFDVVQDPYA